MLLKIKVWYHHIHNQAHKARRCKSYTIEWPNNRTARLPWLLGLQARTARLHGLLGLAGLEELAGLRGLAGLARIGRIGIIGKIGRICRNGSIGRSGKIGRIDKDWQDWQDRHDIPQTPPDTFLASLRHSLTPSRHQSDTNQTPSRHTPTNFQSRQSPRDQQQCNGW